MLFHSGGAWEASRMTFDSLEFVIDGEASVGAWEEPGPLQLHAPNGGNLT